MATLKPVHWSTITTQMRQVLEFIGQQEFATRFYLAGGTALALQLGHRRSIDLDFFSERDELLRPMRREIIQVLTPFAPQVIEDVDGNLLLIVAGLQVGFFSYGYHLLETPAEVLQVPVASLVDIGLMKLDALISRGSRKDFYDLYVILQQISLAELLALGKHKYPYARDFELMAVESLVLFDNADQDHQPELFIDLSWEEVRSFFIATAQRLGQSWFGEEE